jgi:D-alanyl-lipoteichoic acid acyltransferase DltB (MBOAT superfamily)
MAIAVYLLLILRLPGKLIFRFGLFNLVTLIILLGWKISFVAFGFVVSVWAILNLLKNKSDLSNRPLICIGFYILLFSLFLLHKLNLANIEFTSQLKLTAPWFPADILLSFFVTLSFSYIFVRCIDLARSCIWENTPLIDPISLMGYLMPFHMLVAGPVNIYDEHVRAEEKLSSSMTPSNVLLIINEITTGLFYKFVLSEGIRIYFYGLTGNILIDKWFDPFVLVVYVFFDFAGYSKIARGLGHLYGIPTPVNFNAPFLATSVTEFFTRWHMSMGQFIRRNLFTPIQLQLVRRVGIRWSSAASIITLVISFGFVGLWHRLSWTWFLWGIAMGVLMAGEKFMLTFLINKKMNSAGGIKMVTDNLGRLYVFLVVAITVYFTAKETFPE